MILKFSDLHTEDHMVWPTWCISTKMYGTCLNWKGMSLLDWCPSQKVTVAHIVFLGNCDNSSGPAVHRVFPGVGKDIPNNNFLWIKSSKKREDWWPSQQVAVAHILLSMGNCDNSADPDVQRVGWSSKSTNSSVQYAFIHENWANAAACIQWYTGDARLMQTAYLAAGSITEPLYPFPKHNWCTSPMMDKPKLPLALCLRGDKMASKLQLVRNCNYCIEVAVYNNNEMQINVQCCCKRQM